MDRNKIESIAKSYMGFGDNRRRKEHSRRGSLGGREDGDASFTDILEDILQVDKAPLTITIDSGYQPLLSRDYPRGVRNVHDMYRSAMNTYERITGMVVDVNA